MKEKLTKILVTILNVLAIGFIVIGIAVSCTVSKPVREVAVIPTATPIALPEPIRIPCYYKINIIKNGHVTSFEALSYKELSDSSFQIVTTDQQIIGLSVKDAIRTIEAVY